MATATAPSQHRPTRRRKGARARARPASEPATEDGFHRDEPLTRRWSHARLRLLTPARAWLLAKPPGAAEPTLVGEAPAGSTVEVAAVYRAGPLTADLRILAHPEQAPETVLMCHWHALADPRHGKRAL
jgi:hypothetical protein